MIETGIANLAHAVFVILLSGEDWREFPPTIHRAPVLLHMHLLSKDFTMLHLFAIFISSKHGKNYKRLIKYR